MRGCICIKGYDFWVWVFGDFIVRFVGEENAEIFVQNEYTQRLLLDIVNIVIAI